MSSGICGRGGCLRAERKATAALHISERQARLCARSVGCGCGAGPPDGATVHQIPSESRDATGIRGTGNHREGRSLTCPAQQQESWKSKGGVRKSYKLRWSRDWDAALIVCIYCICMYVCGGGGFFVNRWCVDWLTQYSLDNLLVLKQMQD